MKALLIVAHGSRLDDANESVRELAARLKQNHRLRFDVIDYAFLEFGGRRPEDRLEKLIMDGAESVVIFPLFLAVGKHVSKDIPRLSQTVQERFPKVKITVTTHLGAIDGIDQLLVDEVLKSDR